MPSKECCSKCHRMLNNCPRMIKSERPLRPSSSCIADMADERRQEWAITWRGWGRGCPWSHGSIVQSQQMLSISHAPIAMHYCHDAIAEFSRKHADVDWRQSLCLNTDSPCVFPTKPSLHENSSLDEIPKEGKLKLDVKDATTYGKM